MESRRINQISDSFSRIRNTDDWTNIGFNLAYVRPTPPSGDAVQQMPTGQYDAAPVPVNDLLSIVLYFVQLAQYFIIPFSIFNEIRSWQNRNIQWPCLGEFAWCNLLSFSTYTSTSSRWSRQLTTQAHCIFLYPGLIFYNIFVLYLCNICNTQNHSHFADVI